MLLSSCNMITSRYLIVQFSMKTFLSTSKTNEKFLYFGDMYMTIDDWL